MASMESMYGKEVLLDMVNAEVMEAAAKKYKIKVNGCRSRFRTCFNTFYTRRYCPYNPMMKRLLERVFVLV